MIITSDCSASGSWNTIISVAGNPSGGYPSRISRSISSIRDLLTPSKVTTRASAISASLSIDATLRPLLRRALRESRPVGADQARRRRGPLLAGFVVAVLLAAAALAGFLVLGRGGTGRLTAADVGAVMRSAGCTFRTYAVPAPPNGSIELASRDAKIRWPTSPPSAGRHYSAGSVLAFYGRPLEPAPIVKNLENGVVVIWYGPQIAPAFLHRLENFYQASPEAMLASPQGHRRVPNDRDGVRHRPSIVGSLDAPVDDHVPRTGGIASCESDTAIERESLTGSRRRPEPPRSSSPSRSSCHSPA